MRMDVASRRAGWSGPVLLSVVERGRGLTTGQGPTFSEGHFTGFLVCFVITF